MSDHSHTKADELHVYWIPADLGIPLQMKVIPHDLDGMKSLVGGWLEIVYRAQTPILPCGCRTRLVANEEGLLSQLPTNLRASKMLPEGLVGDCFLIGEGPVEEVSVDFFSLPQIMINWMGPGTDLPWQG